MGGLRDDAARWAAENARVMQGNEAAAAAAAVPLLVPDWHAEFVAELRARQVPQFPVHTWANRKRQGPWKPRRNIKFKRTGTAVWIVKFREPDNNSRAGWSVAEYLGVTDSAIGSIGQMHGHAVDFAPFIQRNAQQLAAWRPRVVQLFAALTDGRRSAVDGATGATVEVLSSLDGKR